MSMSISPVPKPSRLTPAFVETAAGLSAGAAATLLLHPLDIIKTRLQGAWCIYTGYVRVLSSHSR
jgi:hypothetical protein